MLSKIKTLLGLVDTSKDDILLILIDRVSDYVRDYCHIDNVSGMENTITQMVVYQYNLLGNEGVGSESYSGVTFNYDSNYPQSIINQLNAHRRLRVW